MPFISEIQHGNIVLLQAIIHKNAECCRRWSGAVHYLALNRINGNFDKSKARRRINPIIDCAISVVNKKPKRYQLKSGIRLSSNARTELINLILKDMDKRYGLNQYHKL